MTNPILLHFEAEMHELSNNLKKAEGYLACEKIIIQNIRKHADNGCDDAIITKYLQKVSSHIDCIVAANEGGTDCINYRYAGGFLNILLRTPCWNNWVKTIET